MTTQSVSHSLVKTSNQDNCHFLGPVNEGKWYGSLFDKPHGQWNSIVEKMMQEFAKSGHAEFRCSSPLSRGVLKRMRNGKVSIHYNAQPHSGEMLMKTIVSVNQLNFYRAVLTWYLERRSEDDNVPANTYLDISQELGTKLSRCETLDLLDMVSRNRQCSVHKNISVEFKSRGQVSREARFSKLV